MGVIGVMMYITSITPNKSAPHNKDEVKALYLKFRASGVDHTANILHRAIGDGSLSTLQRFANQFNEAYVKIKLSEIDKKRVLMKLLSRSFTISPMYASR